MREMDCQVIQVDILDGVLVEFRRSVNLVGREYDPFCQKGVEQLLLKESLVDGRCPDADIFEDI
jgi:hypothetical protein